MDVACVQAHELRYITWVPLKSLTNGYWFTEIQRHGICNDWCTHLGYEALVGCNVGGMDV